MLNSFSEIEEYVLNGDTRPVIALANAQDEQALDALILARQKGVAEGILIGDIPAIRSLLQSYGEDKRDYRLISCLDEKEAAYIAVGMVSRGEANIPMKGIMQTSSFLKPVLDRQYGFVPPGSVISEATIIALKMPKRLLIGTDCAINIQPNREEKAMIASNAAQLARALHIERPRIAMISAVETVNPKIQSTVDASEIARHGMADAIIEGPFALDNAVSLSAARHKGVTGEVAGQADILVFPDLCSGNVFHKTISHMTDFAVGTAVCGTTRPIIMCSRTDSRETKYNSILLAIMQEKSCQG